MNISLIGYGKMGKMIEETAVTSGHKIISRIDPFASDADFKEITAESVNQADVCIEFSHPSAVKNNIDLLLQFNKQSVIGTTGWNEDAAQIKEKVTQKEIGFIYGSNFSIGVNLFYRMIENAAVLMNKFDQYDISGYEAHHNQKADSPSGTAKSIAEILQKNIDRKTSTVYELGNRKILPEELHFPTLRCGSIPGTHKVIFDSIADTIELTHTARSRLGFAMGAVKAAEWISKKTGFFNITDMFDEILN